MATKKKINTWIQGDAKHEGAVKHPGAVKRAAAKHGRSVAAEAKVESHSPSKSIASRGRLALRFQGKAAHGNFITKAGKKKSAHKRTARKA